MLVSAKQKESAKPSRNMLNGKPELRHHQQSCLPQTSFVGSPEQGSLRAIVLPSASALVAASTNSKVFVKVFKTSLFPNLITNLI